MVKLSLCWVSEAMSSSRGVCRDGVLEDDAIAAMIDRYGVLSIAQKAGRDRSASGGESEI